MLSVFIFGQPFEGLSYPFLDFGQPFKFFAIRLSGYGICLNTRVSHLLSAYNCFSRPFNRKALVSVFPWRVTQRVQSCSKLWWKLTCAKPHRLMWASPEKNKIFESLALSSWVLTKSQIFSYPAFPINT